MPPESTDPIPANNYTELAVQLGVIQEGQRNTLQGIGEIKDTLSTHGNRLGTVESKVEVVIERVNTHDAILQDSKPEKGRWTSIGSFVVAAAAIVFLIFDRFYLPAAH